MTYSKFIPIPLFIATQATIMMIIEPMFGFVSWISFQAWAMYFLAGCTPKMGVKTLLGYFGGAIISIGIMEGAALLGSMGLVNGTNLYLAVFIIVIFVISAEYIPWFDFVASWFVGAGVFFGLMNLDSFPEGASVWAMYGQSLVKLMWSCIFGLVFGAGTVVFRTWYEQQVNTQAPDKDHPAVAAE
ncbi:DUF1097 domain-containing protein [uncultured Cohaesibacter sp.]|uniref:DUF1097 domain-containing protein n=1 Tax=uncultured Cohaesibacter sp. TaxID=1002546 RepID=UPI00292F8DC9|nr:DUF1097 domain-containing protein [uncultured Cohaesibacter sp.]